MSTSKIINDFNKCLFREKYYDFKFNTNNSRKNHMILNHYLAQ